MANCINLVIVIFMIINGTICMYNQHLLKRVEEIKNNSREIYGTVQKDYVTNDYELNSYMYPRGDKRKLAELSHAWGEYYSCSVELLGRTTRRRVLPNVVLMVFQGAVARLPCKLCAQPGSSRNIKWMYTKHPERPFSEVESYDRMTIERGIMTIYNVMKADEGVFWCRMGAGGGGLVIVEVTDTEPYTVVKPRTSRGPHAVPTEMYQGVILSTKWSRWSECSVCGKVGRRHRYGVCYVNLDQNLMMSYEMDHLKTAKNTTLIELDDKLIELFQAFPGGLPCRSQYLPKTLRAVKALQERPSEIMIGMCKVSCSRTSSTKLRHTKTSTKIGYMKTSTKIGHTKSSTKIGHTKKSSTKIGHTKTSTKIEHTKSSTKIGHKKISTKIGHTKKSSTKIGHTKTSTKIGHTKTSTKIGHTKKSSTKIGHTKSSTKIGHKKKSSTRKEHTKMPSTRNKHTKKPSTKYEHTKKLLIQIKLSRSRRSIKIEHTKTTNKNKYTKVPYTKTKHLKTPGTKIERSKTPSTKTKNTQTPSNKNEPLNMSQYDREQSETLFFSLKDMLPKQPPMPVRNTIFAVFQQRIALRCPGTTLRDVPILWKVGTKAIVPRDVDRGSGGRVHINCRDHLVFTTVYYRDENLYSCWQRGNLAGSVQLVVWAGGQARGSQPATLGCALLLALLLLRLSRRAERTQRPLYHLQ